MRRPAAGLAVVALLAPAAWLAAPPAEGAGAGEGAGGPAATATAVAQGVRTSVIVPKLLVVETLADLGGMLSQADLTAVGGQAFASSVYPGDPATIGQAAGTAGLPRPPDYPLYVAASHPSAPKAEAAPPGQQLSAEAGEASAAGRAAAGAAAGPASGPDSGLAVSARTDRADAPRIGASESTTRTERMADGSVVARAESLVEGAVFPGGLALGTVRSVVTATLRPGAAAPDVQASTTVTGAAVGGTPVTIGPDGITAPGPVGFPAGTLAPLEEQLRKAGTSIRRIGATPVAGGGSTDVVEVRTSAAPPVPGLPEGIVVWRLAGATAVVAVAGPGGGSPVDLAPPVAGESGSESSPSVPFPTSAATPGESDPSARAVMGGSNAAGSGAMSNGVSPVAASLSGGWPSDASGQAADGVGNAGEGSGPSGSAYGTPGRGNEATETAARLANPALAGVRSDGLGTLRARYSLLYLVLILAGLAAFAASAAFRSKGAHARWS